MVAPHPLLDRHRDHQFTTIALLEALESWPGECELWLYTNHAIENEAWPLGPRDAMTGLPPWSGGDLFFSRIYSHPLDVAQRKRKLVALEAMHDLRPFDLRDGESEAAGGRAAREAAPSAPRTAATTTSAARRGPTSSSSCSPAKTPRVCAPSSWSGSRRSTA